MALSGHCLCGAVTYRTDADPVAQAVCHCTDCQRQTGTAYSIIVGVPREGFHVEGDTLSSFATNDGQTERNFCSACGSPLFSLTAGMPQLVFIKAGTLDDVSWFEPGIEVWTRSAQPWTPHFEDVTQLEQAPG